MLKVFFPAGLELPSTLTHQEYQANYNLLKDKQHLSEQDKTSILLISRVFSLLSIECAAIDREGRALDFEANKIDFDLSQFNTYVRTLKFLMKSNFQTIMYRMYRLGRADIKMYQEALSMQSFNKESNNLFGYVIKVALSSLPGSLYFMEPWEAVENMMTQAEY